MAKSNKPIVWGPFAAGGTVTAFVIPVLIVLTLLAALGDPPRALSYDALRQTLGHWLWKLVVFGVLTLSLWSSAHRLRITFFDFGVRQDKMIATVLYLLAAIGTLAVLYFLLRL
jgi:fumarate reductase subunit D